MNIVAIKKESDSPFDSIRRIDEQGNEFWLGRELMSLMGYTRWASFETPINQAIENLELNQDKVSDHFYYLTSKSQGRDGKDFKLTRYACYMTALCCDGRKPEVASAKKYFAIKTREAETVIPQLESDNETLRLMLELERERNKGKELDSSMLHLHGDRVVLALRGLSEQIIEKETIVTEVVEPATGKTSKILTADQLKKAVKERTGQKLKSLKDFADSLREAGRDDLLIPVTRSQTTEYPIPDRLDEAISVVYGKIRQKLIGE
jgi:hypothetical protein